MANYQPPKRIEIARLDESIRLSGGGAFCVVMLAVGAFLTFIGAIFETSAVRSAASGAVWTGWNVIWGIGMLMGQRRTYTVTRLAPEPEPDTLSPPAAKPSKFQWQKTQ